MAKQIVAHFDVLLGDDCEFVMDNVGVGIGKTPRR